MVRLRLIHDRTGEGKPEKDYLIQIEVYDSDKLTQKTKKKYISTEVHCKPGQ